MMLSHATLGFCIWDIFAGAILLAVAVRIAAKTHRYHKMRRQMERELTQADSHNTSLN